jgi:hypothetical protein
MGSSAITKAFSENKSQIQHEPEAEPEDRWKTVPPDAQKVSSWLQKDERPYKPLPTDDTALEQEVESDDETDAHDQDHLLPAELYWTLMTKNSAFEWLLSNLRRDVDLQCPEIDRRKDVRTQIVALIRQRLRPRVSRKSSTPPCEVQFVLDWDPFTFVKVQEYEERNVSLANALTISGTAGRAASRHGLWCFRIRG